MIFSTLLLLHATAFARETWVIGSSPAARAVAMGLADGRVISRDDIDLAAAARQRPRYLVHEGALSAADAARVAIIRKTLRTKLVHLGDPVERRRDWDVIVNPRFEPTVAGPNVLRVDAWPTPLELRSHVWPDRQTPLQIRSLPSPRLAVIVSGPRDGRTFTSDHARTLGETVRQFARANGGSVFVIVEALATEPAVRSFLTTLTGVPAFVATRGDHEAEHKILTTADRIVIAGGSIDALAAALATDKPIYLFSPQSTVGERFKRFSLGGLNAGRIAPVGEMKHEPGRFERSTTTARLIEQIRAKLGCESDLVRERR